MKKLQTYIVRLTCVSRLSGFQLLLAIIEHLQRANKATNGFLADAHNRMLIKKTI